MPAGRLPLDITGHRYGRLVAIRPTGQRQSRCVLWEFKCDCGGTCFRGVNNVRTGNAVSCGCFRRETVRDLKTKHGLRNTRLWHVWAAMKQRCLNPRCKDYKDYGARGIAVCDQWKESFAAFIEDMGARPTGASIERVDNDGPYAPSNCVWATKLEQSRNRRPVDGGARSRKGWAKRSAHAQGTPLLSA